MIKVICDFLGVIICYIISLICYKNITNYKINLFKFRTFIGLTISSFLSYINNSMNFSITRAIIHLLILMLLFFIVFYEDIKKIFVKTLIIYLVACVFELILSFIIVFTKNVFINNIQENVLIKLFFSTIIMMFTLLFFELDRIKIFINKIIENLLKKRDLIISFLLGLFLCAVIQLIFKIAVKSTINIYINNLFILIIILLFFMFFIIQYFKTKKAEEKEEILLDFMSKYEKILDNDRINKHEILNNLLILKSFENKNTKKYEEVLNDIIKEYENKDKNIFISLYNLPSGLKGLLYYKIYEMKNAEVNVLLNISNKILPKLEKINPKNFMKLCKILGIVLDNAKEAAENSDIKEIIIDIYEENKKTVIYIENTTKNIVKIDKIYEKNYSTKGKNRGLGLYIVKEIIKNSSKFELKQFINDFSNFVSIISIK